MLGGSLRGSWGVFEGSWVVFGGSCGVLGRSLRTSWGVFGGSWGVFRVSGGVLGGVLRGLVGSWVSFGYQEGSQEAPRVQNGAKKVPKRIQIR